jgi:hypothetical protein
VPQAVVDVLEAVQIEQQDREGRPAPAGAVERMPQPVDEQRPVGQARQLVVQRGVSRLLLRAAALVTSKATPMVPVTWPPGPREGSTRAWKSRPRPLHLEFHGLGLQRAPVGHHGQRGGGVGAEELEGRSGRPLAPSGASQPIPSPSDHVIRRCASVVQMRAGI